MDSHFSVSANHVGLSPSEYVVPGETEQNDSRGTYKQILSRNDFIEKQEASKFKFNQEEYLYDWLINLQNHCFHHWCSTYCWQIEHCVQKYNRDIHERADNVVEVVNEDNNVYC